MQIENGTFQWEKETKNEKKEEFQKFSIKGINLNIEAGSSVVIVGKVGSGKTSILLALMDELVKTEGTVKKNGKIAYIPQEAFLLNDTIRANILFGLEYKEDYYNKVVKMSQLEHDLSLFPAGDMTQIGERGINLSGGQK